MRLERRRVVTTSFVAALAVLAAAAGARAQQDEDLAAITKTVRAIVDTTNSPTLAKASAAELKRALRQYYVKDEAGGMKNGALFFGPTSQPISRGASQYVDNIVTNLVFYRAQGIQFTIELNELQVSASGSLGVASARTTSVMTAGDGHSAGVPGRWTAVFERDDSGRWLISHEHLSFYGANAKPGWPLDSLRKQGGQ